MQGKLKRLSIKKNDKQGQDSKIYKHELISNFKVSQ